MKALPANAKSSRGWRSTLTRWVGGSLFVAAWGAGTLSYVRSGDLLTAGCCALMTAIGGGLIVREVRNARAMRRYGAVLRAARKGELLVVDVELAPRTSVDVESVEVSLDCSRVVTEDENAIGTVHLIGTTRAPLLGRARLGHGDVLRRQVELKYADAVPGPPPGGWSVELRITPRSGALFVEQLEVEGPPAATAALPAG